MSATIIAFPSSRRPSLGGDGQPCEVVPFPPISRQREGDLAGSSAPVPQIDLFAPLEELTARETLLIKTRHEIPPAMRSLCGDHHHCLAVVRQLRAWFGGYQTALAAWDSGEAWMELRGALPSLRPVAVRRQA